MSSGNMGLDQIDTNTRRTFRQMVDLRIFQGRWKAVVAQDAHTIRSHGSSIAKKHLHDWLILLLLAAIEAVLYTVHPFYRFVGKDMMDDLKYPFQSATLPTWPVPIYAVLLPIGIFGFFYIRRRGVYDLHHSILGLLYAVLITGVITDVIKNAVGRPRPDFFWRCFPDGIEFYEKLGNVACHGKASDIKEGHRSFPSGHASWSFAGLGFLSLYLSGKIKAFDRTGHIAKHCILFLPLLAASLVGISRIDDYWHHWTDVVAGGLIGLVTTFCYLQFFPPPYDKDGWGSHAYIRSLVESGANSHQRQASNTHGQVMKYPEITQLSGQTGYLLQVSGSHHNASPISDDLEARRVV